MTELLCQAAPIRLCHPRFLRPPIGAKRFKAMSVLRRITLNCSGSGWVTDFMGTSQAYTAMVIASDTGDDMSK